MSRETSASTFAIDLPEIIRTVTARDAGRRVTAASIETTGTPTSTNYLYDAAGRTQRQWGSGFDDLAASTDAYMYDASTGHRIGEHLLLRPAGSAEATVTASYTFTSDGSLDTSTINGVTEYDNFNANGTLTSFTKAGVLTTLAYDSDYRLQSTTTGGITTTYSWDMSHGRRISQITGTDETTRVTYSYTDGGRLASYERGTETTATYSYDALGQRTRSQIDDGHQVSTTDYVYYGLSLLQLSTVRTDGERWQINYVYDESGRPYLGIYRSTAQGSLVIFTLLSNDRGDVLSLLDSSGAPFASYRYDAWGKPQGEGSAAPGVWSQGTELVEQSLAASIAVSQPLRFSGYYYDSESGMYYLSARYYDPVTRQCITKDPLKSEGEESHYQYASGNPVESFDQSGLAPERDFFYRSGSNKKATSIKKRRNNYYEGWAEEKETVYEVYKNRDSRRDALQYAYDFKVKQKWWWDPVGGTIGGSDRAVIDGNVARHQRRSPPLATKYGYWEALDATISTARQKNGTLYTTVKEKINGDGHKDIKYHVWQVRLPLKRDGYYDRARWITMRATDASQWAANY